MYPLDFETKSSTPISRGHDNYCQDPDADILCLVSGHIDVETPDVWVPGGKRPDKLIDYVHKGGLLAASNASFDQAVWEYIAVNDYDFPPTKKEQWYCTQAQARVAGLPSSLDATAKALGLKIRKSRRGSELIKLMSIPPFSHTPELLAEMVDYCVQDWHVMKACMLRIPHMTQDLFEDYVVNQIVNERGIKIDRELAQAAQSYAVVERDEIAEKIRDVTCGEVEKHTQHVRFKDWILDVLTDDGCDEAIKMMTRHVDGKVKHSVDKTVRANMLADPQALNLSPDVIEALTYWDDAGGTAVSKFTKMLKLACDDDRVRGAIRCFGAASTLRYSSLGLQVHNMRRDAFSPEDADFYKAQMIKNIKIIDRKGKPVRIMETLGRLLRSAIIPEDGKVFVVADWSAVESMMTAFLAGDKKKLELFRRGECAYCYAAESIYHKPINKEDNPDERQVGKVADLACGFLGGTGALASMAAQYRIYVPEDQQQNIVDGWRARHPKVVQFGDRLQAMAMAAMRNEGVWFECGPVAYKFDGTALFCRLPDGKTLLRYPEARIEMTEAPWGDLVPSLTALKAAFKPKADSSEWPRHGLWRGLLLENVVQASCAIMLRDTTWEFQDCAVFHVHDELILEVDKDQAEGYVSALQEAMETPPDWCEGLPLKAPAGIMTRYGK